MMQRTTDERRDVEGGYVQVDGLRMYYEVHGTGRPLVLLHGALMFIEAFGELLPKLAQGRQVIAVELQGHGRTNDVDRPFSYEQMADDVAALLHKIGIESADLLGYSLGGGVAMQMAIRHPDLVRRVVAVSVYIDDDGVYPEILEGERNMTPESLEGFGWREAYARVAPDPERWSVIINKVKQLDLSFKGWSHGVIRSIRAPVLLVVGDSDIVRPEHAAMMFRLLGGGVAGDIVGMPRSRLAVLPATNHTSVIERTDWLVPMVEEFLNMPAPGSER